MDAGVLDSVTQEFLTALSQDYGRIQNAAQSVFSYLATIQLTITALRLSLQGESLQRLLIDITKLCLLFSVYYACVLHAGQWIPELINAFIEVGGQGTVQSLSPSSVIAQGLGIVGAIWKISNSWHLFTSPFVCLMGFAVCISILIIYGFITAELCIILVKSYVLVCLSSLFLAFGSSEATRPMATNFLRAVIGIGLKMMTLYLLLDVGQRLGNRWATILSQSVNEHTFTPMLVILITTIVFYKIVKNVPPFIASLSGIGGFYNHGDAAIGMAVNAGFTGARTMQAGYQLGGRMAGRAGALAGQGISQIQSLYSKYGGQYGGQSSSAKTIRPV